MKRLLSIIAVLIISQVYAQIDDVREAPDGASIQIAPDGGYQVFAVGTGTYDFDDPDDINDARRDAEMRAKAAIAKFLKSDIYSDEMMAAMAAKTKKITSDDGKQSVNVSKESFKKTLESIRSSAPALLSGVIVLQDAKIPGKGNSGSFRVMVGVTSKTVAIAKKAANDLSPVSDNQPVITAEAGNDVFAEATAAEDHGTESELPPGWIVCIGVGTDRKDAVQQALIEGVSQIYGQLIQNDERLSERMIKFKKNANIQGDESSATVKSSVNKRNSNTLTRTAGFVREYRVIQIVPNNGNQEATVYALIVNPRAAGTVALRVCSPTMAISTHTKEYQLGPKRRMTGAEIGKVIRFALPNSLMNSNRFLIINDESIDQLIENKSLTEAMVDANLTSAAELMQAGQGLTPDFSIQTEITEITYSKKLGMDKITKKLSPQYKMGIKLNMTLTNDRTGQVIKADSLSLALDSQEIAMLLEEDEEYDLLEAILVKLADPIDDWIGIRQ